MAELVELAVVDLILDERNARLPSEQRTQQDVYHTLAVQQGSKLLTLAAHIVENGVDPLTVPGVVPVSGTTHEKYRVVEGNRRVLAIKALETPALVFSALSSTEQKRLTQLAEGYADDPVDSIPCVLFESEDEAELWIELRHTGENAGAGLVPWTGNERDRFSSRHGDRSTARQVLDFIDIHGAISEEARSSSRGIITTITRALSTPELRRRLGLSVEGGKVYSHYPVEEVTKSLSKLVEDLKLGKTTVADLYTADDRRAYAEQFADEETPDVRAKLASPAALDDLVAEGNSSSGQGADDGPPKRKSAAAPRPRKFVVPRGLAYRPHQGRIAKIHDELRSLSVEKFPNACSVLLRVYIELSVDYELRRLNLMTEEQRRNLALSNRMKQLSQAMKGSGRIDGQLHMVASRVADEKRIVAASSVTWNQYVHNEYIRPRPDDLRDLWDEMQPFMEAIWLVDDDG